MFFYFFQGIQQDIKLFLIFPILSMLFRVAFIKIQQFTAFKPLAHRPKPMLAKP